MVQRVVKLTQGPWEPSFSHEVIEIPLSGEATSCLVARTLQHPIPVTHASAMQVHHTGLHVVCARNFPSFVLLKSAVGCLVHPSPLFSLLVGRLLSHEVNISGDKTKLKSSFRFLAIRVA